MKVEVEIISKEIIKPSTPTPDHLRRYQLSFLDQLSPSCYSPFLYFYALNDHINEPNLVENISHKLKESLSQVLTLYYPLAGRFTNDDFVYCNDDGILFLEARVRKCELSDVVNDTVSSSSEVLNKLCPFKLDELAELPLGIQLNIFENGGITIGVCISHRLADALSCLVFIKNWMAIARGDCVIRPEFSSAELFPPKNTSWYNENSHMKKINTIATKRFVFEASAIEALRSIYDKEIRTNQLLEHNTRGPSRVEVLSTFIWSRFMAATRVESEQCETIFTIHQAVNLRPKFDPPLREHSFGNYYRTSTTVASGTSNLGGLAKKMGEDVRKLDKGFVESLRFKGDEYLASLKPNNNEVKSEELVLLVFTSLCRFPLYEADFGWGKPTWVSSAARCFKNVVAYMDDKTGHGIEAYISLKPEEMAKLEADKEFLSMVSCLNRSNCV
ncbi:stemmadenine O-acetyltransferase-like [Humulus lupulus]|uniref:stemmadenine O-acetyltransferase-like n=1 Tax=Humulus lupulus TaxID=3486 RepID=UPI002B40744B|nr:stemmadenine O-acetyltransferase-like [Humulus lupulus]